MKCSLRIRQKIFIATKSFCVSSILRDAETSAGGTVSLTRQTPKGIAVFEVQNYFMTPVATS